MPNESSIREFLIGRVADRCNLRKKEVDPDRPLADIGFGSRDAVAIIGEVEEWLGCSLPPLLLYEYPTITHLAHMLMGLQQDRPAPPRPSADRSTDSIAVVGLGCRFPGGIASPEAYWGFLIEGGDAIGEVPAGRWEQPDGAHRFGGFLEDVAGFDSRFFGITPSEADAMDPQQRLLLEVAYEALDHAGIAPRSLHGTRTGVFVGISSPEYALLTTAESAALSPWTATGVALSIAANRLSYVLDLHGTSLSVDTACSSSLVAVHLAVQDLRAGHSDLALAAGVNVLLSPTITKTFDLAGATAPDGRCKAFDASANGMVRAEGCGLVVLKRLADAYRDGDRVLAVIQNTAVNSDGRSNGLAAPSPEAQKALLREAYTGLTPPDYVEAHGTGTLLGDPIEAHALGAVLGQDRAGALLIGSVKTNLGHLESAAGIAGLIKTVLALWHRSIPPSLHYHLPNPHIDFDRWRLKVVTEPTPWPSQAPRAGVSAFGFGGTNAHVVLAAAPEKPQPVAASGPVHTLLLSDVSAERVAEYAGRLAEHVVDPANVVHTLARRYGRGRFGAAVLGRDREALTTALRALARGRHDPRVVTGVDADMPAPVWVFSGYGAQRPGMGRTLLAEESAFAATIDLLEPMVQAEAGFSVREALRVNRPDPAETMVVLFAVQVGLARLWQAYGVKPAAVIGHSMGEVAAVVVAGALSLRDGVTVICHRARLLSGIAGGGAMCVLGASAEEAAELSKDCPDVHLAVRTAPRQTVLTGDAGQIATVVSRAERRGLLARLVRAEGAGHSPQVEPLLAPFREQLAGIRPAKLRVPLYSTVLDNPRRIPAFDGDYWAANMRDPVRLVDAVQAAAEDGHRAFIEISAHPLLTHALSDTVRDSLVLPTLRGGRTRDAETDDTLTFHAQLAALRLSGSPIARSAPGRVIDVPGPSWRYEHHWMPARRTSARSSSHPLLGAHVELPGGRHAWSANVGEATLPWLPLHGVTVLPAAAYAEIVLAAGAAVLDTDDLTVRDLRVSKLLPLDEQTTITTSLTIPPQEAGGPRAKVRVQTRTPSGHWTLLATASVGSGQVTPRDMAGRVPVAAAERADHRFRLHPVVLDRCLAAFGAEWTAMGIGSVRVLGPTWEGGSCEFASPRRRKDGTAVAALRLVDETGRVLLEADGVLLRRLPAASVPVPLSAKLVEAVWSPTAPHPPGQAAESAGWLVLADPGDSFTEAVTGMLTHAGHRITARHRVSRDHTWRDLQNRTASPDNVALVVPAWLADEELVLSVSALVRALPPDVRLWFVTRRSIAVRPGEAGEPGQAFLRALVRVLAFEHPALRATLVDVDDPVASAAELLGGTADTEVAWRDGVRYVARLRRARLGTEAWHHLVRPGGAYAISGGYGGLGLVTAQRLVERGARRLVLSGRSGPGPEAEKIIGRLRRAGAEIEIVQGDIAAPGVAERMVAAGQRDGVPLRGVVHAAGGLADRLFTEVGPEDLHRVWAPKVTGALRLHEATEDLDLDWWVVYSSAAALLGSPGQAAYAAANARADALVDWRRAHGLPATTINWGTWADVGGAAGLRVDVLDPLTPEEGADALEALLVHDQRSAGVLRFNSRRALAAFPEIREQPYFSELVDATSDDSAGADDWPGAERIRTLDPGTARRLVRERVSDRVATVLGFTPDPARPLTELGLDSLVAVRIKSALEHDFGVSVDAPTLLRGGNLADLQAELWRSLGLAGQPVPMAAELAAARGVVRSLANGTRRASVPGARPFFCAHPAGGSSSVYRPLAALLGEDQVIYGLERFEDDLELVARADRYIDLIRATQPEGPYRLGGWSFGGVLAYEIARRLDHGEVELVAMIDAGLPKQVENLLETTARRYADFGRYLTTTYGIPVALPYEELITLDEERQLALVIERTTPLMAHLPPAVAVHQFTSHEDTRCLERYVPGPYDGRVVLYRSTEPTPWTVHDARYDLDEANGFGDLCPRLEIVSVPGTHHLNLLDPPGVNIIADHLRGLLSGSRRPPGRRADTATSDVPGEASNV
ncbi:SDR family NAD(P)-dependent oxidoreductase [Nonomuraea sp. NPDC049269]|uniref:SDR family NAD(P)-dependent oxidoreductase n=1 Tax=Nonomuraea sp. NPDC049269 TaxID=3364349 RepID=UPI0037231971